MKKLDLSKLKDSILVEYFKTIQEEFENLQILKGDWNFKELTFTQVETNKKIPHNLGFLPRDIIELSVTGPGNVTWNYSSFDKSDLNVTTSGACVVRFFVGTYSDENNT